MGNFQNSLLEGVGHPCKVADAIINGVDPTTLGEGKIVNMPVRGPAATAALTEGGEVPTEPLATYTGEEGSLVARAREYLAEEAPCTGILVEGCPLIPFLVDQVVVVRQVTQ